MATHSTDLYPNYKIQKNISQFQEPCAPKIKDRLLAPYIILFLIFIVLSPFLYALFIIIWSKKLKDVTPILNARQKVVASNEARMKRFKEQMENI